MRVALTAFLLGAVAIAAVAFGAAFVVIVLGDASGRDQLRIALGGVELLSFERRGGSSQTALGPALLLLPLVGGVANALAAAVLRARGRPDP